MRIYWKEHLEELTAVNPDYKVAFDITQNMYGYFLVDIANIFLPSKWQVMNNLSSSELRIYFLENVMFHYLSIDDLNWYYDWFESDKKNRSVTCPLKMPNNIFYPN